MAGDIDHKAFISLLTKRFPSIVEGMGESMQGSLYMEMGELARAAQAAISDEHVAEVREHFRFIEEIYRRATPEVKNAIHVSYLERIGFDGKHAKRIKAREMLSPALQAGLRSLEEYDSQLFGPKAKSGRNRNSR